MTPREQVDQYAILNAVFELETYAKHLDCSTEHDWLRLPTQAPFVLRERLSTAKDVLVFFGMLHEAGDQFYIDKEHPLYDHRKLYAPSPV